MVHWLRSNQRFEQVRKGQWTTLQSAGWKSTKSFSIYLHLLTPIRPNKLSLRWRAGWQAIFFHAQANLTLRRVGQHFCSVFTRGKRKRERALPWKGFFHLSYSAHLFHHFSICMGGCLCWSFPTYPSGSLRSRNLSSRMLDFGKSDIVDLASVSCIRFAPGFSFHRCGFLLQPATSQLGSNPQLCRSALVALPNLHIFMPFAGGSGFCAHTQNRGDPEGRRAGSRSKGKVITVLSTNLKRSQPLCRRTPTAAGIGLAVVYSLRPLTVRGALASERGSNRPKSLKCTGAIKICIHIDMQTGTHKYTDTNWL